ncbi:poly(u)-specific endoribonuclease [Plakobranchus ocellatus]|uniref:Uridylate-specific endoribonuclease n=1 Tax=Plakobranchus ocellatus TaxID=259542 RepID=A0AAV3XXZ7_9GAST|nr:poly(u)-specific endoribonuclease [Plakobranchus ocellatus]
MKLYVQLKEYNRQACLDFTVIEYCHKCVLTAVFNYFFEYMEQSSTAYSNSNNGNCSTAGDHTSDHTSDCQSDPACVTDASSCPEGDPNCVSQKVPKLPEGNCSDLSKLTQLLWESDQDRLSIDEARVNFQAQLEDKGTITDKSPDKFFTYVNASQLEGSVYTSFLAMMDNYNPVKNEPEVVTPEKEAVEERFLNVILATPTMKILTDYLVCRGEIPIVCSKKEILLVQWIANSF